MRSLVNAMKNEWRFLLGSPADLALATWIPWLIMALLVAMFFSATPRQLPIAVVDDSRGPVAREIIRTLGAAPAVSIVSRPQQLKDAFGLARQMQIDAILYIPASVDADMLKNNRATAFAFYNASFTTAGGTAYREISAAMQQINNDLTIEYTALQRGPEHVKAPPIKAQIQMLYNPARNFDMFLVGLLIPGILHLILCVVVTSAYSRELRDKTIATWLQRCGGNFCGAVIGKALPYVLLFSLYGCAYVFWIGHIRGDGIAGSITALLLGQFLMYCAYAAFGLLVTGLIKNMGTALSGVGLYAGTSLAFCGATFPIEGASLFARIWHHSLPYTYYTKLDAAERYINADLNITTLYLGIMALFVLGFGAAGFIKYRQALLTPASWGKR